MEYMNGNKYVLPSSSIRRCSIDDVAYYTNSPIYMTYWNQTQPDESLYTNLYDQPNGRTRIMSFSEGKKKKGDIVDFMIKYKTEVNLNI